MLLLSVGVGFFAPRPAVLLYLFSLASIEAIRPSHCRALSCISLCRWRSAMAQRRQRQRNLNWMRASRFFPRKAQ